jgi:hypothetical protein
MNTPEDPRSLTDEELAHARRRQSDPLAQSSPTETRLLEEVLRLRDELVSTTEHLTGAMAVVRAEETRLRAELETVGSEAAAQCQEAAARTVRAETERNEARAKVEAALAIHQPGSEPSQGWLRDGIYGYIETPCAGCEAVDEYAVPWPCATARALGGDQDGGDRDA